MCVSLSVSACMTEVSGVTGERRGAMTCLPLPEGSPLLDMCEDTATELRREAGLYTVSLFLSPCAEGLLVQEGLLVHQKQEKD